MTRSEALYGSNLRSGVNLLHPIAKLAWYRARLLKLDGMRGRGVPFAKLMTSQRIYVLEQQDRRARTMLQLAV